MNQIDNAIMPLSQQPTARLLSISAVVPTRNEERYIASCLDSLLAQDYEGDIEIIVVDGRSDDRTREIVTQYTERDTRVRLVDNPERITPFAFNYGVRAAQGEIVATIGGHWRLPDNFLAKINHAFQNYPVMCVGGRIIREVDTDVGQAIELARSTRLGGGLSNRNIDDQNEYLTDSPNIAYIWRREVFDAVGLFDERLVKNQDNEFNLRTIRAGFQTLYAPRIVFHYYAPTTYQKLYRQMHGYASYTPMIVVKHRQLVNKSLGLPAIALVLWLVLAVLGVASIIPLFIPLALLGVYGIAIAISALVISARAAQTKSWLAVAFAYVIIHVGVSVGYLRGIVRMMNPKLFANLWQESKSWDKKNQG